MAAENEYGQMAHEQQQEIGGRQVMLLQVPCSIEIYGNILSVPFNKHIYSTSQSAPQDLLTDSVFSGIQYSLHSWLDVQWISPTDSTLQGFVARRDSTSRSDRGNCYTRQL